MIKVTKEFQTVGDMNICSTNIVAASLGTTAKQLEDVEVTINKVNDNMYCVQIDHPANKYLAIRNQSVAESGPDGTRSLEYFTLDNSYELPDIENTSKEFQDDYRHISLCLLRSDNKEISYSFIPHRYRSYIIVLVDILRVCLDD